MTSLSRNIQRIAKTDELKRLIEDLLNGGDVYDKEPIDGFTYAAYRTANGGVAGAAGSNVPDLGSLGEFIQNTDKAFQELGTDILDELGDLIDNGYGDVDIDDLLNESLGIGDKLTSLTGLENCSGSEVGQVVLDSFRPPTGDVWDGQPSSYNPGEDLFRAGFYYQGTGLTGFHRGPSIYSVAQSLLPEFDSNDPGNAPHTLVGWEDYDPDTQGNGTTITVTFNRSAGDFPVSISFFNTGCSIDVDSYCPSKYPDQKWPSDGVHQLKWDGAQFRTSPYENDSDLFGPWENSPSKITGCSSSGTQFTIQGTNDGDLLVTVDSGANSGDTIKIDATSGEVLDIVNSIKGLTPSDL